MSAQSSAALSTSTKERVFQTAIEMFARNGYHATGIADISEAVGLGRGALYHHIRSKEYILYVVVSNRVQAALAAADEILIRDADSFSDRLRVLSRSLLLDIANHRAEWTVFFRELASFTGSRRDDVLALRDQYEQRWSDLLLAGAAAGEFRSMDPLLVKGILGLHNYAYLWIDKNGRLTPEAIADEFCDLMFDGIGCRSPADTAR